MCSPGQNVFLRENQLGSRATFVCLSGSTLGSLYHCVACMCTNMWHNKSNKQRHSPTLHYMLTLNIFKTHSKTQQMLHLNTPCLELVKWVVHPPYTGFLRRRAEGKKTNMIFYQMWTIISFNLGWIANWDNQTKTPNWITIDHPNEPFILCITTYCWG